MPTTYGMMAGHVVLFPMLSQGHMNPFLDLARLLAARHPSLLITVVTTAATFPHLRRLFPETKFPSLRLAALPFDPAAHGLPASASTTFAIPGRLITPFYRAVESALSAPLHCLLSDRRSAADPPLLALVADMFLAWTAPIAASLGVFHAVLYTSGPFAMAAYNHLWAHLPLAGAGADEFLIPGLPGGVAVKRSELSPNMLACAGSPDDPGAAYVREQADLCRGSDATLWNTAEALEKPYLAAWARNSAQPVFAVGPLFAAACRGTMDVAPAASGDEDPTQSWRLWLESRPPKSVAYVSFGSMNRPPPEESAALAAALEKRRQPFLWAAPAKDQAPPTVPSPEMGLVLRYWVPQIEILGNPAIGAFVSHCGWNSALESMTLGIPVVAWPLSAEQFLNAKLMAGELGTAVAVAGNGEEAAEAVAEAVGDGARGKAVRRRAAEVAAELSAAVSEEEYSGQKGSSLRALDEFVELITKAKQHT